MANDKLTHKQELFCNYYIECAGNASEAYRQAYDASNMKRESVNRKAIELLADGKITARVKELQAELKEKSDIAKERILQELEAILDAKITDYLDFDGKVIKFKDFKDLTEKQARAVEGVKKGTYGVEIKLHDKSGAIERICKMLGYDAPDRFEGDILSYSVQTSPLNDISVEKLKKIREILNE
ncbi:MAG: terminase small subunit [Rikenellaceae bacterium]|nr:terminase small subunit [Rikenellaceae bacterium]